MPTGTSGSVFVLIVGPPSLAGTTTDVTNYGRAASCRFTESSRLSGSHPAVRVHSSLKRNHLNRRWFQRPHFKPQPKLVFDYRYLSRRQSKTVYSKQTGEIVIEVDEVEADSRMSRAGYSHLPSSEPERSQGGLEHGATYGVKDSIDAFPRRQFQDPLFKIFGLGINHRLGAGNRIGSHIRANHARVLPVRDLDRCLSHRTRRANNEN